MSETVRVEIRFKNAELFNAIQRAEPPVVLEGSKRTYASFKRWAEKIGVGYGTVMAYLALSQSPWGKDGELRRSALKISFALDVPPEKLFPKRLYTGVFPRSLIREIDGSKYLSLAEARRQHLLPVSTEETNARDLDTRLDLTSGIGMALNSLTPAQRRVIEMRFGLTGEHSLTLEEIGKQLSRSPQSIRQQEARALRNLRHPSRARRLRQFIDSRAD